MFNHYAMSGGIAAHIFNLVTRWSWVVTSNWIADWVSPRAILNAVMMKIFLLMPGIIPLSSWFISILITFDDWKHNINKMSEFFSCYLACNVDRNFFILVLCKRWLLITDYYYSYWLDKNVCSLIKVCFHK